MADEEKVKQQMCGAIAYLQQEVEGLGFVLIGLYTADGPDRGAIDITSYLCDDHLAPLLKEALSIVEKRRALSAH